MKLETPRLILRTHKKTDAKDLVNTLKNKNVAKLMADMPYPYTIKIANELINKILKNSKEKCPTDIDFVIEIKSEKKLIGEIGLFKINYRKKIAAIYYWLNEEFWGQGLASEAVKKILDFGFSKLKLRKIELACNEKNEGSKAIAKKFGFKLEGILRKAHMPISTNKIADKFCYGLLKEEWRNALK